MEAEESSWYAFWWIFKICQVQYLALKGCSTFKIITFLAKKKCVFLKSKDCMCRERWYHCLLGTSSIRCVYWLDSSEANEVTAQSSKSIHSSATTYFSPNEDRWRETCQTGTMPLECSDGFILRSVWTLTPSTCCTGTKDYTGREGGEQRKWLKEREKWKMH